MNGLAGILQPVRTAKDSTGMPSQIDQSALKALADGRHSDPFSLLGMHKEGKQRVVRTLQPQAQTVSLVSVSGEELCRMKKIHAGGLFQAEMPARLRRYRLRITNADGHSYDERHGV